MSKLTSLSRHPLYTRWVSTIKRYSDHHTNNCIKLNKAVSGNISLHKAWCPPIANGFEPFAQWIEEQLAANPDIDPDHFRILRKDAQVEFGPDNCYIVSVSGYSRNPELNKQTKTKVVKENTPEYGLSHFEALFR